MGVIETLSYSCGNPHIQLAGKGTSLYESVWVTSPSSYHWRRVLGPYATTNVNSSLRTKSMPTKWGFSILHLTVLCGETPRRGSQMP